MRARPSGRRRHNGIVLTADGTAQGGITFSIVQELQVPVMYVGEGGIDITGLDAEVLAALLG